MSDDRTHFYDVNERHLAEREIARLRRQVDEDDAEMPVWLFGAYGLGGLVSWIGHPFWVAAAGFGIAGWLWIRSRRKAEEVAS